MSTEDLQENRGYVLYASIYPVAFLATAAIVGRLSARRIKEVPFGADDFFIIAGLVLTWGICACSTLCVQAGVGRHLAAIPDFNSIYFLKVLFAANQIYLATGPVIKIGVLLMYGRIFCIPRFKLVVKFIIVALIMWYLAFALVGVFICIPVAGYWDKSIPATCINLLPYDIAYAVCNITFDVVILSLPIPMIWRLHTTRLQKIALTLVFLLGAFTCITALIRLLSSILNVDSPDITWVYLDAVTWTAIEPAVGVISACLPTLWPLVSYLIPRVMAISSLRKSSRRHSSNQTVKSVSSGSASRRFAHPGSYPVQDTKDGRDQLLTHVESGDGGHGGDHNIGSVREWEMKVTRDFGSPAL